MRKTVALIMTTIISISLLFAGCGTNPSNNHMKFLSLSQSERQAYVKKALEEKYGETFEISELHQRRIDFFHSEDDYFATARCAAQNYTVCVWVDMDGKITDTGFMMSLKDDLNRMFDDLFQDILEDYKVSVYTDFTEKPDRIWTCQDNLKEMLGTPSANTNIRLFINQNQTVDEELLNEIVERVNFCNSNIYIYECDDPEKVNVDSYDLSSLKYSQSIKKTK